MAKRKAARTSPKKDTSKHAEAAVIIERASTTEDLNRQVDHLYVNHAEVSANYSEVRIAFADLRGQESIAARGGVVMSHLTAKRLSEILAKSVEALESKFGPITALKSS